MRRLDELSSLKGRVALVTGGSGHLGQTIAETLLEMGAAVALVDLDNSRGEEIAGNLGSRFPETTARFFQADLEKADELVGLASRVHQGLGGLNLLVNNAALVGTSDLKGWGVEFKDQSPETWRRALEVNVTAPFILTQACSSFLEEATGASIINIGSIYGVLGPHFSLYEGTTMGNPAAYAASKAALLQFTRWCSTALAPKVRCNAILAGGILRGQPVQFVQRYSNLTPLARMACEEDFKGAIAYLASDLSSYVTGQHLAVDGGWTAW